jgi:hypothetical protein
MSSSYKYDPHLKIVVGKIVGQLDLPDYNKQMKDFVQSDEFPSDVNTLWDLREMDFSDHDYQMEERIVKARGELNKKRGNAKVALVVESAIQYGMARVFQSLADPHSSIIRVFYSYEDAQDWVCDKES